ncbi:hypothetical protein RLT57_25685 [Streptomyces sp. ITFR-21]|nr:hypothetical protein [Streptomyces sp. ITFR-21]WNI18590.1 hypothetical protein RLT57_25685 [Streptomyces sp. ITFR-21]
MPRAEKVLFPARDGAPEITKADLAAYHRDIARYALPHLKDRPLMLEIRPDGVDGQRFMRKNVPAHYPDWIRRVELPKEGGTVTHELADSTDTLVHLAAQGCVTPHRWLSRADRPRRPDLMVFGLGPSPAAGRRRAGDGFPSVRVAARRLGELLDELELPWAHPWAGLLPPRGRSLGPAARRPRKPDSERHRTGGIAPAPSDSGIGQREEREVGGTPAGVPPTSRSSRCRPLPGQSTFGPLCRLGCTRSRPPRTPELRTSYGIRRRPSRGISSGTGCRDSWVLAVDSWWPGPWSAGAPVSCSCRVCQAPDRGRSPRGTRGPRPTLRIPSQTARISTITMQMPMTSGPMATS